MTDYASARATLPLEQMFRPRSVAIVGASTQEGSPRNMIVKILIKHGFAGRIYPVTPTYADVEGHKAYKTLADIPEVPDAALIITPAATVPGIIAECGAKGVACAIVYSAGFEETEAGKDLALELAEAARTHNVAVLGANCQGLWSVKEKSILNFASSAMRLEQIRHAPIAIISQSGALSGAMGSHLQRNGLGCSYIVSVGNETCLDALDILAWIIEQDDVKVALLYVEGLDDAARLLPMAAVARQRGIQIVMLKAGRTAVGLEATSSHTGKIASPYAIYRDVLAQAGVIVVDSISEALDCTEVLSLLPDPRISGDAQGGISIVSSSGGASALLADHAGERGLPLSEFSPATLATLSDIVPAFGRKANPVDLTGQVRGRPNLFKDALAAILAEPRTEAMVIQFASGGRRDLADNAEAFKAAARDSGVPMIITFAADRIEAELRDEFKAAGILISDDPSNTMQAIRWLYDRKRMAALPAPAEMPVRATIAPPVSWEETMDFLETAGVTPAKWCILPAGSRAAEVCADLAMPLVVKVLPSEAEHKTELGLVKLKVNDLDEVDRHAAEFRRILNKPGMPVLVQEMTTDGVEAVLSCLRNTDFGPVMLIGTGGVAIELYKDVAYLAPPVTPEQVREALKKLKLWTLLNGFRGAAQADVEALVAAATRFGDTILATPELVEGEINPVLVRPDGKGIVAVDFLGKSS